VTATGRSQCVVSVLVRNTLPGSDWWRNQGVFVQDTVSTGSLCSLSIAGDISMIPFSDIVTRFINVGGAAVRRQ